MISLVTNTAANQAMRLNEVGSSKIRKAQEQLSTGRRINSSADDAAGLAMSHRLRMQTKGLRQANQNIQDGMSMLETADGGLSGINTLLQRGRTLAIQAANDILTTADRGFIQTEIDQILEELDHMVSSVTFNEKPLLTGLNYADVVVVLDDTGSMNLYFAALQTALQNFSQQLANSGIRLRMGLTTYGDDPTAPNPNADHDMGNPIDYYNLTNDVNSITSTIGGLASGGGGDLPESGLEAIEGSRNLGFLNNSQKFMLFVTDAGVHDRDDGNNDYPANGGTPAIREALYGFDDNESNYDLDQVISDLQIDGTTMHVLGRTNIGGVPLVPHQMLAQQSGGSLGDITNTANYTAFLNSVAGDIINAAGYPISLHIGANQGDSIELEVPVDARRRSLGLTNVDVTTQSNAEQAISQFSSAIDDISEARAVVGSYMNTLSKDLSTNSTTNENTTDALSRIEDSDLASSLTLFTKEQITNDIRISTLAQANLIHSGIVETLIG